MVTRKPKKTKKRYFKVVVKNLKGTRHIYYETSNSIRSLEKYEILEIEEISKKLYQSKVKPGKSKIDEVLGKR